MTSTIGILGAGTVGKTVARFFLTAGRNVVISNNHGPDSLGEVIAELGTGAEAGTNAQAAQAALVVLATPWTAVESTLAALPPWSGNTLIDATNAIKVYDPPTVELFDFGDRTSSEVVASLAPGASVIKAFNHIPIARLLSPVPDGEQHVLFISGDDTAAKADLRSPSPSDPDHSGNVLARYTAASRKPEANAPGITSAIRRPPTCGFPSTNREA